MKTALRSVPWIISIGAWLVLAVARDVGAGESPMPESVYGEWRIRVKPDQGAAYDKLIEQSGLPLFRAAGGRMVGWWKTLVGDLYEHVTIWEYDGMPGFDRAIQYLSKNKDFAAFVARRDPLLSGEESRFMRLVHGATPPSLPETSPVIIHEIHRVPPAKRDAYLAFIGLKGIELLRAHGLKPAGPWIVDVGRDTEVTLLFRYPSLTERQRLLAEFSASHEGILYRRMLAELTVEVTNRVLIPAPFAAAAPSPATSSSGSSSSLPHREVLAPGVHVAGFDSRHLDANCGWVALDAECLLIDLPRGIPAARLLELVAETTGKPARRIALTSLREGDKPILRDLLGRGIREVVTTPRIRDGLIAGPGGIDPSLIKAPGGRDSLGDSSLAVEFHCLDDSRHLGAAAVSVPARGVLFAGPLAVNGPREPLSGADTQAWLRILRAQLQPLEARHVVPGFGTWGGPEVLARQVRYLAELRRVVGYHIAQGRTLEGLRGRVRLPADCFAWTPYGEPVGADVEHVFHELTVPAAPFLGRAPSRSDLKPHALVLIGDQPHEPGHLEEGLAPAFEACGVVAHFTVDVRSLSAENLQKVALLVVLRDGLQRPDQDSGHNYAWTTPSQERAVVDFVENGGGFLNLHNAMGLYPPDGPYLDLVGGRYIGHGPLERFRVEILDPDHPVTRGVRPFFVADEQHTPPVDEKKVHLLLRNRSDDGKAVAAAGWVREVGRGRVCHLANGHTLEALLHPMYQRLLRNAIPWCLRRERRDASLSAAR